MTVFTDLKKMHDNYGFTRLKKPGLLSADYMDFRLKFLVEELEETMEAYDKGDLPEVIDGLLDLAYVAIGTIDLMGVNGQAHWNEIQRANMSKRVVSNPDTSKRGFAFDLEKPLNWKGPDHESILNLDTSLLGQHRIVYLEGPDGAGKTTLINQLAQENDIVIHNGPYPTREEAYEAFLAQYEAAELALCSDPDITVFIDRGPISELVYGAVLRDQEFKPTEAYKQCLNKLRQMNGKIILCMPKYTTALNNWRSRLKEELIQKELNFSQVYLKYSSIQTLLPSMGIDFEIYNYEEMNND